MSDKDFAGNVKRFSDMMDETRLVMTILQFARSGHATDVMVEQAIALVDRHVVVAKSEGEGSLLKSALDLKSGLEKTLVDGVKSLRVPREPGDEARRVEEPLARVRTSLGHQVRRQHRCAGGVIDIFDVTADELIECKLRGTSAALGEAAGQLKRYGRSFPGSRLTIAVLGIEPDADWLAEILRRGASLLSRSGVSADEQRSRRARASGDLPDGQRSQISLGPFVQPFLQKYFCFSETQITAISPAIPSRSEGRTRRHERWVRDAMDAVATQDERRWRGRRSRVVLTPRRWRQVSRAIREATVATKPGHREEHEGNR